jgi:hypothetical protein
VCVCVCWAWRWHAASWCSTHRLPRSAAAFHSQQRACCGCARARPRLQHTAMLRLDVHCTDLRDACLCCVHAVNPISCWFASVPEQCRQQQIATNARSPSATPAYVAIAVCACRQGACGACCTVRYLCLFVGRAGTGRGRGFLRRRAGVGMVCVCALVWAGQSRLTHVGSSSACVALQPLPSAAGFLGKKRGYCVVAAAVCGVVWWGCVAMLPCSLV